MTRARSIKLGDCFFVLVDGHPRFFRAVARENGGLRFCADTDVNQERFFLYEDLERRLEVTEAWPVPMPSGQLSSAKEEQAYLRTQALRGPVPISDAQKRHEAWLWPYVEAGLRNRVRHASKREVLGIIAEIGPIAGREPPGWRTVSDKLREVRKADLLSEACPQFRARGNRSKRLGEFDPELTSIIREMTLRKQRATLGDIRRAVRKALCEFNEQRQTSAQRVLTVSDRTIQRRIKEIAKVEKEVAVEGSKGKRKYAVTKGTLIPDHVLELVDFDHTSTDTITRRPVHRNPLAVPLLSVGVDRKCRAPIGVIQSFYSAGRHAMLACYANAIQPHDDMLERWGFSRGTYPAYGRPLGGTFDAGMEWRGIANEAVSERMELDQTLARPLTPTDKAICEVFFRTAKKGFFWRQPGSLMKQDGNGKWVARSRSEAEKDDLLTPEDLLRRFWKWLIFDYWMQPHAGLKDPVTLVERSPRDVWMECRRGLQPDPVPSADEIARLLAGETTVTIQSSGVRFQNVRYGGHSRLTALRGKDEERRYTIHYSDDDIGRIYLLDPETQRFIRLEAVDERLRGRTRLEREAAKVAAATENRRRRQEREQEEERMESEMRSPPSTRVKGVGHAARRQALLEGVGVEDLQTGRQRAPTIQKPKPAATSKPSWLSDSEDFEIVFTTFGQKD